MRADFLDLLIQCNPILIPAIHEKTKNPKLGLHQVFGFSISRHSVLAYLRANREESIKDISKLQVGNTE